MGTTKVLEQAKETDSHKVVNAAGTAIAKMQDVREAEGKSGCNRCSQCMCKNVMLEIKALESSIKEREQQCGEADKQYEELEAQHKTLKAKHNIITNEMEEKVRKTNAEKDAKINEASDLRDNIATQDKVLVKAKEDRKIELRNARIETRRVKHEAESAKADKLAENLSSCRSPKDNAEIVQTCKELHKLIEQRTDATIQLLKKF